MVGGRKMGEGDRGGYLGRVTTIKVQFAKGQVNQVPGGEGGCEGVKGKRKK